MSPQKGSTHRPHTNLLACLDTAREFRSSLPQGQIHAYLRIYMHIYSECDCSVAFPTNTKKEMYVVVSTRAWRQDTPWSARGRARQNGGVSLPQQQQGPWKLSRGNEQITKQKEHSTRVSRSSMEASNGRGAQVFLHACTHTPTNACMQSCKAQTVAYANADIPTSRSPFYACTCACLGGYITSKS